jgi:hypothetical protein
MVYGGTRLLEGIIRPDEGGLSPELAQYLLTLDFTPEQHARYATLSGKAEAGTLTDSEAAEIDEYLATNALLTVLQSKARLSLKHHQPAA